MPIELDISPLERAIALLGAALARQAQAPGDDIVRDACIQRFQFTYELSHKLLKRFLEATSASPADIDAMSFQNLIRTGSERGGASQRLVTLEALPGGAQHHQPHL